jgi:hypothetical protein
MMSVFIFQKLQRSETWILIQTKQDSYHLLLGAGDGDLGNVHAYLLLASVQKEIKRGIALQKQ